MLVLIWEFAESLRRWDSAKKLNQFWSSQTSLLVKVFSPLVMRDDLGQLTTDRWKDVISVMGFRAYYQKWCPHCLKEDPYERLLWTLTPVESCPVHKVELLERCPGCHVLASVRKSTPGWLVCPTCKRDRADDEAKPSSADQDWIAGQVSRLLIAEQEGRRPNKNRLRQVWEGLIIPRFPSLRAAELALGMSKGISNGIFFYNSKRATFSVLLGMSRRMSLNLDELLLNPIRTLKPIIREFGPLRPARVVDRDLVKTKIVEIISQRDRVDLSVKSACKEIGIATETLRLSFPDLGVTLINHFRILRRQQREINRQLRLARAVKVIKEHGPDVSNAGIQRSTGHHNYSPWKQLYAEARNVAFAQSEAVPSR